ncbi:hypothetical protein GCM10007855_40030 [Aliivibrio sifiae]|nr:hypothetical protein GCM10007855_40030 [Aliivibrio sifiae]
MEIVEVKMSKIEITEETLRLPAFKIMISFMFYIVAVGAVLVAGVATAIVFKDFAHLGRAGAVITLIAISMAYKDFCLNLKNLSFNEAAKLFGKNELYKIWAESFVKKYRVRLKELYPKFSVKNAFELIEEINYISAGEFKTKEQYLAKWLEEMLNIWSRNLRVWEFRILFLGTLLWAFSDLINKLLGW